MEGSAGDAVDDAGIEDEAGTGAGQPAGARQLRRGRDRRRWRGPRGSAVRGARRAARPAGGAHRARRRHDGLLGRDDLGAGHEARRGGQSAGHAGRGGPLSRQRHRRPHSGQPAPGLSRQWFGGYRCAGCTDRGPVPGLPEASRLHLGATRLDDQRSCAGAAALRWPAPRPAVQSDPAANCRVHGAGRHDGRPHRHQPPAWHDAVAVVAAACGRHRGSPPGRPVAISAGHAPGDGQRAGRAPALLPGAARERDPAAAELARRHRSRRRRPGRCRDSRPRRDPTDFHRAWRRRPGQRRFQPRPGAAPPAAARHRCAVVPRRTGPYRRGAPDRRGRGRALRCRCDEPGLLGSGVDPSAIRRQPRGVPALRDGPRQARHGHRQPGRRALRQREHLVPSVRHRDAAAARWQTVDSRPT